MEEKFLYQMKGSTFGYAHRQSFVSPPDGDDPGGYNDLTRPHATAGLRGMHP